MQNISVGLKKVNAGEKCTVASSTFYIFLCQSRLMVFYFTL